MEQHSEISESTGCRQREDEFGSSFEPPTKKARLQVEPEALSSELSTDSELVTEAQAKNELTHDLPTGSKDAIEDLLPSSRALLPSARLVERPADQANLTFEADVGITEYVSQDVPPIHGIIKQRFTDFLVNEIDQVYNVLHLKVIGRPDPAASKTPIIAPTSTAADSTVVAGAPAEAVEAGDSVGKPIAEDAIAASSDPLLTDGLGSSSAALPPLSDKSSVTESIAAPVTFHPPDTKSPSTSKTPWPDHFDSELSPFLSSSQISHLKEMFLQGPTPPLSLLSDSGWGGMKRSSAESKDDTGVSTTHTPIPTPVPGAEYAASSMARESGKGRGKGKDQGRAWGSRGGRGGGRDAQPGPAMKQDPRSVISDPIPDKAKRTALHEKVRALFQGKLESEVNKSTQENEPGPRIEIKWNPRASQIGRGQKPIRNSRDPRDPSKPFIPPYIHFNMQKANRDTQDAISHISRLLKCQVKDLGIAGTKDKRGVTVQRVSLRRGHRTLEDVWRAVNAVPGRRSAADAITFRGERGVRIGDLCYKKQPLELGDLKGNSFVITLRNVKAEEEVINAALDSLKTKGFINYYGMQRFGTSTVPTHSIGLALLQSDWRRALDLILRPRPGETEEANTARRAWINDRDIETALQLMPRRMVAERCVLEAYQKNFGSDSDMQNALHAIPKNLRTMYVHAYQSYVWNAIASERLARFGHTPVAGDLVFDIPAKWKAGEAPRKESSNGDGGDPEAMDIDVPDELSSNDKKKHLTVKVKTLTEADLANYSIFDIILPLPGFDVSYPGGEFGEKYRAFMKLDGLNPEDMTRQRVDYSLSGSYRKIMHLPKHVSWKILRYTDPEVPLAQSDEDTILGLEPAMPQSDGKFVALQIELQLGSAVYATMALREITKTETSSHFQTTLTQATEDQAEKGSSGAKRSDEEVINPNDE